MLKGLMKRAALAAGYTLERNAPKPEIVVQQLGYQPSLDGLRTFAVAGVMLAHLFSPRFIGGGTGVELFFGLSGYLITRLLLGEEQANGRVDLWRFYWRRLLRLYPALLTLAAALLLYHRFFGPHGHSVLPIALSVTYLMDLNRAFAWTSQGELGHTWSLATEEHFYLLWPLLLIVCPRRLRLPGTVLMILAIFAWRGWLLLHGASVERVYNGFDTHADGLLMGCAAALAGPRFTSRLRWPAIPALGFLIFFAFMSTASAFGQGVFTPLIEAMGVWLVVTTPDAVRFRQIASQPVLTYLGRRSYGIYLWHVPVLVMLHRFGHHAELAMPLVSVAVAATSFRFVETPFLKLKNRARPPHVPPHTPSPA